MKRGILVCLIAVLAISSGCLFVSKPKEPGVIAAWKLDEGTGSVAYDSVGTSNGGIYNAAWVDGRLEFNGTNSLVRVPHNGLFGSIGVQDFTVEAWYNSSQTVGQRVVSKGALSDNYRGWQIFIENSGVVCGVFCAGGARVIAKTDQKYPLNEWHHVVITYARDGNMTIYMNGEGVKTADISVGAGVDISVQSDGKADDIWIGQQAPGISSFKGFIGEVRLYDYVLGAEEVIDRYNESNTDYAGL